MGKQSKINLNNLPTRKRPSTKNRRALSSLFDDADYEITQTNKENDFDKLYQGKKIKNKTTHSPDEQYLKASKKEKADIFEDTNYALQRSSKISDLDRKYLGTENAEKSPDNKYSTPISVERIESPISSIEFLPEESIEISHGAGDDGEKQKNLARCTEVTAIPVEETKQEIDAEKIDRALAIAEDFSKREGLILVGDAIYRFNGRFYALLSDKMAQRMVFFKYRKEVSQTSTANTIRNVGMLLKYSVREVLDEFPINMHLIIFENGTLELNTGHFRKNSPDDFASSALGINYDPDRWKMPHTQHFLETIANGDDDLYELMLQVIGYILSNDIRAKSFFYLEGVGDAGKSRFCDLIASFFPVSGSNKVARIALQDLGGKYAMGNLVNTKLNISEDLPDNPLSPTTVSRIKMISDSNRLEAEAKYVQPFSFRPVCKLLFASNHPLRIKEYDAAFINRVVYLPFLHAIPKEKQDKNILEKMQQELPALFNHAFQAYKRLVANGYEWAGSDRFKPQICTVNSGLSIDKELVLRRFVDACCTFDENATVSVAELQSAYEIFCQKNGFLSIRGDRFSRELFSVLPDTVVRIKIGNQKRGIKGLKLEHEFKWGDADESDVFSEI